MQYLHNRLANFDEIWNGDARQPAGLAANKILQIQKFKMAAAVIWKIEISLPWMDQYRENLARRCASILQTPLAVST